MRRITFLALAAIMAGVMALQSEPASANDYYVTKTADTMDFVCNADCSLREAIWEANNIQGPHVINIPAGTYTLTIPGAGENAGQTGDLDIGNDVEIFGDENPIIEMHGTIQDRVFHVHGGTVLIAGVTIRNGIDTNGGGINNAGNLRIGVGTTVSGNFATDGGGVHNSGSLTIDGGTVSGNLAGDEGGGVFSYGQFHLNNSVVTGNHANEVGGGMYLYAPSSLIGGSTISNNTADTAGGGIHYEGGINTLNSSTISNNSTSRVNSLGGGIDQINADTTITATTISGNYAENSGGGIASLFSSLRLNSSSIFANSSRHGGGLYNYGVTISTNSTFSGNGAFIDGGAIYHADGNLTLSNSTLATNGAAAGGGVYALPGPLVTRFQNSVLANTVGNNCAGQPVTSLGYNLSSDGSCALGGWDVINAPPLLGPLAYNGGSTPTHALLEGSPAADAAEPICTTVDQRGGPRPQGLRCDIGAYEAPDSDTDGASDPVDTDDDNDGKPDAADACTILAEDYDGFQDSDGCPDPDNDGDGVCDAGQTSASCSGSDTGKTCFDPAGTLSCPTIDCRNAAEHVDAFKDSDGCPEPDNDNDSFPDATDACPGADASAGPNGMFGAAQDLNHNGVRDGAEAALTTDDVMPLLMWEDKDGVLDTDGCHDSPGDDFDGDGLTDDSEVFTYLTDAGNPDTDADAVIDGTDNCPNWANASQALPLWTIPADDSDCDGWNKTREQHVGTDPTKHCNATTTINDEADAWPTDFNDSGRTNLSDVSLISPSYNKSMGQGGYSQRFDLSANNIVTLVDVSMISPYYNKACS